MRNHLNRISKAIETNLWSVNECSLKLILSSKVQVVLTTVNVQLFRIFFFIHNVLGCKI